MSAHAILAALGIYAGAFVVGAVSSIVPIVSIDVFIAGVTLAAGPTVMPFVIPLAAAGQLVGKLPIYYASLGVATLQRDRVAKLRKYVARWQQAPHLVLATSAVAGLPPFSLAATAAGVLAIRLRAFAVIVFAGRALRFALVVAIAVAASR